MNEKDMLPFQFTLTYCWELAIGRDALYSQVFMQKIPLPIKDARGEIALFGTRTDLFWLKATPADGANQKFVMTRHDFKFHQEPELGNKESCAETPVPNPQKSWIFSRERALALISEQEAQWRGRGYIPVAEQPFKRKNPHPLIVAPVTTVTAPASNPAPISA
jgi:hypothetical protein